MNSVQTWKGPTSIGSWRDELVHIFLNGASGFAYFSEFNDFHDMEYYLVVADVLRMYGARFCRPIACLSASTFTQSLALTVATMNSAKTLKVG
jgi:hypothetical protein